MAGRPFLSVALPATATAAVAWASYMWYKKVYPDRSIQRKQLSLKVNASSPTVQAALTPPPASALQSDFPVPPVSRSSPSDSSKRTTSGHGGKRGSSAKSKAIDDTFDKRKSLKSGSPIWSQTDILEMNVDQSQRPLTDSPVGSISPSAISSDAPFPTPQESKTSSMEIIGGGRVLATNVGAGDRVIVGTVVDQEADTDESDIWSQDSFRKGKTSVAPVTAAMTHGGVVKHAPMKHAPMRVPTHVVPMSVKHASNHNPTHASTHNPTHAVTIPMKHTVTAHDHPVHAHGHVLAPGSMSMNTAIHSHVPQMVQGIVVSSTVPETSVVSSTVATSVIAATIPATSVIAATIPATSLVAATVPAAHVVATTVPLAAATSTNFPVAVDHQEVIIPPSRTIAFTSFEPAEVEREVKPKVVASIAEPEASVTGSIVIDPVAIEIKPVGEVTEPVKGIVEWTAKARESNASGTKSTNSVHHGANGINHPANGKVLTAPRGARPVETIKLVGPKREHLEEMVVKAINVDREGTDKSASEKQEPWRVVQPTSNPMLEFESETPSPGREPWRVILPVKDEEEEQEVESEANKAKQLPVEAARNVSRTEAATVDGTKKTAETCNNTTRTPIPAQVVTDDDQPAGENVFHYALPPTSFGHWNAAQFADSLPPKPAAQIVDSLPAKSASSGEETVVRHLPVEPPQLMMNVAATAKEMMFAAVPQTSLTASMPAPLLSLQLEDIDYSLGYDGVPLMPGSPPPSTTSDIPRHRSLHRIVPSSSSSSSQNPQQQQQQQQPQQQQTLVPGSAFDSANQSPSEDMLESPCVSNYSDIHSEESSDSGKGGSDIHMPTLKSSPATPDCGDLLYEFELPQDLCGLLIGQHGNTIKFIKSKSRANVYLKRHHYNSRFKLCVVSGSQTDVDMALRMIRSKFPLSKYPVVTLAQVNTPAPSFNSFPLPDTMQLFLPEGIMCDVVLSSLVTAGHFFVQQPTHPTYPALTQLYSKMLRCYAKAGSPVIPLSVQPSSICAAPVLGGWYRAEVNYVSSKTECGIKYLDYGGYSEVPINTLRQIRGDFLTIPFQASECYLANVKPVKDEEIWTIEANGLFEELAQGQFLQAQVVGYAENGIPYVHLYRIQGITTVFINRELVSRGVAVWYDHEF